MGFVVRSNILNLFLMTILMLFLIISLPLSKLTLIDNSIPKYNIKFNKEQQIPVIKIGVLVQDNNELSFFNSQGIIDGILSAALAINKSSQFQFEVKRMMN